MSDEPPYILDISGLEKEAQEGQPIPTGQRKWIGINFECCGIYTRIYRNKQGTAYVGRCPHCHRQVRVHIGPGGINHRLFRAL